MRPLFEDPRVVAWASAAGPSLAGARPAPAGTLRGPAAACPGSWTSPSWCMTGRPTPRPMPCWKNTGPGHCALLFRQRRGRPPPDGPGPLPGLWGSCTYKNARRALESLRAIPLEQVVLETDCPYLSPQPVRGKRNHSGNIQYGGRADRPDPGPAPETVFETTAQNARRLFGL